MNQDVYFGQDDVNVSSSYLRVNNNIYTIQSILYIRVASTNIWRGLAVISVLLGFILMVDEGPLFVIGGLFFFVGVLFWISSKPVYSLYITNSEGEMLALSTRDKQLFDMTMDALYGAMADNQSHPDNIESSQESPHNYRDDLKGLKT